MKATRKSRAERITEALAGTSVFDCMHVRDDVEKRLERIAADASQTRAEVIGLERALKSYVEAYVLNREPRWSDVRAIHRAWVVAGEWNDELREAAQMRRGA